MIRKILLIIIFIFLNLLGIFCTFASSLEDYYYIYKSKSYDENIQNIDFSPDFKSYKFTIFSGGKEILNINGNEINKYDNINKFLFSPSGSGYSYIAMINYNYVLVKDGIEHNDYQQVYDINYSIDGKSFSYIAEKNGKSILVKDGVEIDKYDGISAFHYPKEIKESFIYITMRNGKYILIKDGIESKEYNNIGEYIYSNDFKNFAFIANKKGKLILVNNLKNEYGDYDNIYYPFYLGKDIYFFGEQKGKTYLVKNGVKSIDYDYLKKIRGAINGKSFMFIAVKDGKYVVNKNGKDILIVPFEVKNLELSSDGKSYVFSIIIKGKQIVIKDGKILGIYNDRTLFNFNYGLTNKEYSFIVLKGNKYILVKDGLEIDKYDNVNSFRYSPDKKSYSYVAERNGKFFVVKDGVEGKEYDSINTFDLGILYSKNGNSYSYLAEKNGKSILVKDGVEIDKYDGIGNFFYLGDSFIYFIGIYYNGSFVVDGIESESYKCIDITPFHTMYYNYEMYSDYYINYSEELDKGNFIGFISCYEGKNQLIRYIKK
ncbi:hypothetical protein EOM39_01095 [Candidatus Gracilibacteria bacterium]|nr:hypothetical protein [Candidatus Gracilibacteria bacterium]